MPGRPAQYPEPKSFSRTYQHTHLAVYLSAFWAVACLFYDSTQVP
jgi:hypothetical protein